MSNICKYIYSIIKINRRIPTRNFSQYLKFKLFRAELLIISYNYKKYSYTYLQLWSFINVNITYFDWNLIDMKIKAYKILSYLPNWTSRHFQVSKLFKTLHKKTQHNSGRWSLDGSHSTSRERITREWVKWRVLYTGALLFRCKQWRGRTRGRQQEWRGKNSNYL